MGKYRPLVDTWSYVLASEQHHRFDDSGMNHFLYVKEEQKSSSDFCRARGQRGRVEVEHAAMGAVSGQRGLCPASRHERLEALARLPAAASLSSCKPLLQSWITLHSADL